MFLTTKRHFEELNAVKTELSETKVSMVRLQAQLEAEIGRRERAELEFSRLQDDFKGLVALTAGRIPPKLTPQFDKDPWAEDNRLPETFLTPPEEEMYGSEAEAMLPKTESDG